MSKKIKIPAFYQYHWPDGRPASCWTTDDNQPDLSKLKSEWFWVYHPAQEVEVKSYLSPKAKIVDFMRFGKEVDMNEYRRLGSKLTWKQRLCGVL